MLNYQEWVNASGYSNELPYNSKKHFAQYGGSNIAQDIQNTAANNPLITHAPNHLRIPMLNPYIFDWGQHLVNVPIAMSDPDTSAQLGYGHSMFRHEYYDVNVDNQANKDVKSVLFLNGDNPVYARYRNNVQTFKEMLETVSTGPFKNYPFGNQISRWLCDTFMAITKNPETERFTNMGFFGVAMSNGATIDLNRIKALISKLTPAKDGVPQDINAMKEYIEKSELFRELSATNKYFALSSTLNQFWNKSAQNRSNLYTNPNSEYMKFLKAFASNRQTSSKEADAQYMHSITDMYYKCANTSDSNKYITTKDEQRLLNVCNRYFTNINVNTSK